MSFPDLLVYSRSGCQPCRATERTIMKKGIPATVLMDTEIPEEILSLGHTSSPIVVVRGEGGEILDHWNGFRPDNLNQYAS